MLRRVKYPLIVSMQRYKFFNEKTTKIETIFKIFEFYISLSNFSRRNFTPNRILELQDVISIWRYRLRWYILYKRYKIFYKLLENKCSIIWFLKIKFISLHCLIRYTYHSLTIQHFAGSLLVRINQF